MPGCASIDRTALHAATFFAVPDTKVITCEGENAENVSGGVPAQGRLLKTIKPSWPGR